MQEHVEPNCGRQDILQNEAARSWLHWERGFLIVFAFVGPALYALTAIGLFYRVCFAGFLAWFIFIGPGVAEFTHFIFLLLRPAIDPENPQRVSHLFPNGVLISHLPNYYVHTRTTSPECTPPSCP
jgi:hypothetical protein